MKKIITSILSLALVLGMTACTSEPENVELMCDENGDFTVLLVSDPQCDAGLEEWEIAGTELETLVERSDPDFVLINGDMNSDNSIPQLAWEKFIRPLEERGIKWSTTNGNHDVFKQTVYDMYKTYDNCLNEVMDPEDKLYDAVRPMNYVLPVYSNDGKTPVFAIYAMDTGPGNYYGYDGPTEKQIEWYTKQSNAFKKKNGKEPLTSILCMHVPLTQVMDMYYSRPDGGEAASNEHGGLYNIYGVHNSTNSGPKDYVCENGTTVPLSTVRAAPVENDRGMFNKILEQGDIKAVFSGHDHLSNFIGSYKGVLLGYIGKTSPGAYADEIARGGRVIKFNQENPEDFTVSWIGTLPTCVDQPAIHSDGTIAE